MSITCIWMKDDFHEWKLKKKKKKVKFGFSLFQMFGKVWIALTVSFISFVCSVAKKEKQPSIKTRI